MNDGFKVVSATLAVAGVGLGITPAAAQSTAGGSTSFWAHVQSFLDRRGDDPSGVVVRSGRDHRDGL